MLVCRQYGNLGEVSLPGGNFCHHDKANTLPAIAGKHRRLGDERSTAALQQQVVQNVAAALYGTIEHVEFHIDCSLVCGLHDGRGCVHMPLPPWFELDKGWALR